MANLRLPLKKQWFEMTKSGEKTEDYREITAYWLRRLTYQKTRLLYTDIQDEIIALNEGKQLSECFEFLNFDFNIMTLGCPSNNKTSRILKLEHKGIEISYGKSEWGAEPNKLYFIIKHGQINPTE